MTRKILFLLPMKKLVLILLLVFTARKALPQGQGYTHVTGRKQCYANGSFQAAFVNNSGQSQLPLLNGSVFPQTGVTNFDSGGNLSIYLADNNQIFPSPTQWKITACALSGAQPTCGTNTITITGTTQDITTTLTPFTCPSAPSPPGTYVQVAGDTMTGALNNSTGFVGPVTGNVSGNVTGNVNGNVTGNVNGNVTGTASGNVALGPATGQIVQQPAGSALWIAGNGTGLNASITNGVYNAASCALATPPSWCAGSDIGAWVDAAFAACGSSQCHVYIPSGTYTQTTTINWPGQNFGQNSLTCESAAVLNYSGSGYSISVVGVTGSNTDMNVLINGGCQIYGTASGSGGIRLVSGGVASIHNLRVQNFTNGDGWYDGGFNTASCYDCNFGGNKNGIHNTTVTSFSANAVHFVGGTVGQNSQWGAFEDGSGPNSPDEGNSYIGMTFELNGSSANPAASGNVFFQSCDQCVLRNDYFEYNGNPAVYYNVTLGDASHTTPKSTQIINNWFGTAAITGQTTYSINLVYAVRTVIFGNEEFGAPTAFLNNSGSSNNVTLIGNASLAAGANSVGAGGFSIASQFGGLSTGQNTEDDGSGNMTVKSSATMSFESGSAGQAACYTAGGKMGHCTGSVSSSGACTCTSP